jgi:rhodanese-related sulfurtransferase
MDTVTPFVSASSLVASLGTSHFPLVVDVRRRENFESDNLMIAGATWRDPFKAHDWEKFLPRHRPVVLYCVHGHEISRNAADALRERGIDAHFLEGGIEAWRALQAPTVRRRESPAIPSAPGERSVWVTRERPKIDRIACPWLLRRFIDPLADFVFVPESLVHARAAERRGVAYDVPGVEFTHRGDRCSFDAFIEEFGLQDEALSRLALIVRGADTGRPDLAPECAGLLAISLGLGYNFGDDLVLLEKGFLVYDALYAACRAQVAGRAERHNWTYPS